MIRLYVLSHSLVITMCLFFDKLCSYLYIQTVYNSDRLLLMPFCTHFIHESPVVRYCCFLLLTVQSKAERRYPCAGKEKPCALETALATFLHWLKGKVYPKVTRFVAMHFFWTKAAWGLVKVTTSKDRLLLCGHLRMCGPEKWTAEGIYQKRCNVKFSSPCLGPRACANNVHWIIWPWA